MRLPAALPRWPPEEWTTEIIESALRNMLAETELSARKGPSAIRVAISGSTVSPPLSKASKSWAAKSRRAPRGSGSPATT